VSKIANLPLRAVDAAPQGQPATRSRLVRIRQRYAGRGRKPLSLAPPPGTGLEPRLLGVCYENTAKDGYGAAEKAISWMML
jgi:hypothetical protein